MKKLSLFIWLLLNFQILFAQLDLIGLWPAVTNHTDVWAYTDPNTNIEYGLIGTFGGGGIYMIDLSDPTNPTQISYIENVGGFDMKTYQNYLYSVTGSSGSIGQITDLSFPNTPIVVDTFIGGHNIFIDDIGYLYVSCPGLHIYDLNPNPLNPSLVYSNTTSTTFCHDISVVGNRLYDFRGPEGTAILDVTDRSNPIELGLISETIIQYHHNGWPTEDGNYLWITDEGSRHPVPDITIWDISDPSDAEMVATISDSTAIPHNVYIKDNLAYVAYYSTGLKIFDLTDPISPTLVAHYDTDTDTINLEVFTGAFGTYPFSDNEYILVSDWHKGLFIFDFQNNTSTTTEESIFQQTNVFPNPSTGQVEVSFSLNQPTTIQWEWRNILGQQVQVGSPQFYPLGNHQISFDLSRLPKGIYFLRLDSPEGQWTRKIMLNQRQ